MRRGTRVAAVIALLSACSPDPSPPSEQQAPGAEVAPNVEGVHRVITPESPIFVVAGNGAGKALALLALKDALGNPLLVNGALLVDGDDFLSVEVDTLGRPARFATREAVVELFDYTATSVTVETRRLDEAEPRREEISFDPEELDGLLVSPLDLTLVEKQTSEQIGERLDAWRSDLSVMVKSLDDEGDDADCVRALAELARSRGLRSAILRGLLAGADCAGLLPDGAFDDPELAARIRTIADLFGCVSGVGLGAAAALTGAIPAALLALSQAAGDCPDAVEGLLEWDRRARLAARLDLPFIARLEGELREKETTEVTFSLAPEEGDETLSDVRIDLTALGVPGLLALTRDRTSGTWRWRGTLTPPEAGYHVVDFVIQGGRVKRTLPVYVQAPDELRITLTVSNTVVQPDEVLIVNATVTGGTPPYSITWTRARRGGAVVALPEARDRLELTDMLIDRTAYAAGVTDSTKLRRAQAPDVMVELCGDRFCGGAENEQSCSADCAPESELEGGSCDAACAYRASLGCAGDVSICTIFCDVAHDIAAREGSCAPIALQLEDCRYSRAALSLGCTASTETIDESLCTAYAGALDACEAARDAPAR